MFVRHWMQTDPLTVPSSTLVSEAKRLLSEHPLHALPVVDDGRLRGLVTRANLLRVGHHVLRTQDADEFNFFVTRLRVRDIMVRNPAALQASDTMEHCLRKGRELGVAQFPVLDGGRVVGVISANEIFQIAAHCLGASERRGGVSVGPLRVGPGVIGRIVAAVEGTGAVVQALVPMVGRYDAPADVPLAERKLIVRFDPGDADAVARALEAAGFAVIDTVRARPAAVAA